MKHMASNRSNPTFRCIHTDVVIPSEAVESILKVAQEICFQKI